MSFLFNSPASLEMFDILFRNPLNSSGYLPLDRIDYPIDIWYDNDGCVLDFALIDANLDDLKITKTDDNLFVSYHPTSETPDPNSRYYLQRKIKRSGFERQFRISSKLNLDALESVYSNGLLTIKIPWAKSAIPTEVKTINLTKTPTLSEKGQETLVNSN